MLKVGMAGIGGISGAHIPAWEAMEETELAALCDIRQECLEKYPDKHLYTDFQEMLNAEQLDILDICLPTYLHADYAVQAMERGIHVICEKPVSLKAEDVERVYEAARRNNVKFMVAQVLRFWPEYELLKEIYDSGKYGKLLSGSMSRLGGIPKWSWDNWMADEKRSGLVPFDLHIHDLDFLVYAFGKPEDAKVHRAKRPEQDYFSVVYEYPEFFVTTEASWYAAPYPFTASFRFQFEKAILAFERQQCMLYEEDGTVTDLTEAAEGDTGGINLPKSDAYANEIRYFTKCVLEDRFPERVKPGELRQVIEILRHL
ncbi:MAG: Gfo/Idh/MocA family oxidoreductase [Lachnospiraceae bacterium]|jgi:predicted dehydrogenase|nr:Gfo/Idh/MocA family oxidoreductase [Lachnospiraceae bacterium]